MPESCHTVSLNRPPISAEFKSIMLLCGKGPMAELELNELTTEYAYIPYRSVVIARIDRLQTSAGYLARVFRSTTLP